MQGDRESNPGPFARAASGLITESPILAYKGNENKVQDWQIFVDESNIEVTLLTVYLWQSTYEN